MIQPAHGLLQYRLLQIVAEFYGALDQIALGHHDVNRKFGPQHTHQFIDPLADAFTIAFQFTGIAFHQLIRGNRDH